MDDKPPAGAPQEDAPTGSAPPEHAVPEDAVPEKASPENAPPGNVPPFPGGPGPAGPYGGPGPYGGHDPFGPYPYGPYPYAPYGYGPPAVRTSGLAIASLVTALTLCMLPVGVVLGIMAITAIRNEEGLEGRGLALAGISVSAVGTILGVFLLIGIAAGDREGTGGGHGGPSTVTASELRPGDCFFASAMVGLEPTPGSEPRVLRMNCSLPHSGEVFAVVPLSPPADPTEAQLDTDARERCLQAAAGYVAKSGASVTSETVGFFRPTAAAWSGSSRTAVCVVQDAGVRFSPPAT
ncbi:DUF4190 domain-containing protein [Yinghuangia soli]|uniref:DUF4190 domain-containing protein n=1 Tax=Yinghuangia soli TaxID=2908204 RepID=A0AA41QBB1_9ACTN|nr:DUF4190 domain-containing protein [Yinghuangia soli]MCF2533754.1 DUF4190 domain-containing protein [Yinghuangia soli]